MKNSYKQISYLQSKFHGFYDQFFSLESNEPFECIQSSFLRIFFKPERGNVDFLWEIATLIILR